MYHARWPYQDSESILGEAVGLVLGVGDGMVPAEFDEPFVEGMGHHVVVVGGRLEGAIEEGLDLEGPK